MPERIVIVGSTGFVGSAVVRALPDDIEVRALRAPRLKTAYRSEQDLLDEIARSPVVEDLVAAFNGASAVVNAAGDPNASSLDEDALFGANALLPGILLSAVQEASVRRFIHVSSAVVQNDKSVLDSSEDLRPFSSYSASKVMGEVLVRSLSRPTTQVVRYRPPSVHAPSRRVTRMIRKIARSPFATVAKPGNQPTPQALLPNVASAIAYLATCSARPPAVVHHPSEGVTVASLMTDLSGGKSPRSLPRSLALAAVQVCKTVGRVHRPTAANARRVELLWLGQDQSRSWLSDAGWVPAVGAAGWKSLGEELPR